MFFPESFACNALKKLKMSALASDLKRFKRAGFRFQNGSERIHILTASPGCACDRARSSSIVAIRRGIVRKTPGAVS